MLLWMLRVDVGEMCALEATVTTSVIGGGGRNTLELHHY